MRGVNSRAFVSNDALVVVVVDGAEAVSTRCCFLYDECCCPFFPCCRCCWRSGSSSSSSCCSHLYSGGSSGVGVVGCRSSSGRPSLTLDVAGEYFVAAGGGWCLACCCCADDSAFSSSLAAQHGCSCCWRRRPCIRCRRCRSSCWCCCRLLSKWCPSGSCWQRQQQRQWTGTALVVLKHTQLVAHCACGESSTSLVWCRSPTASALRGCGRSGVAPPNRGRPITYGVKAACGSLHYQKGIQDRASKGSLSSLCYIHTARHPVVQRVALCKCSQHPAPCIEMCVGARCCPTPCHPSNNNVCLCV